MVPRSRPVRPWILAHPTVRPTSAPPRQSVVPFVRHPHCTGNGIRCVGKYLADAGKVEGDTLTVETADGIKTLIVHREGSRTTQVSVDMGAPRLAREEIPMLGPPGQVVDERIDHAAGTHAITAVSMGNPHVVIFVEDTAQAAVEQIGPALECHDHFPERTNVHFVEILSKGEIRQRSWERGSGETRACGTGACACVVAGVLTGRTSRSCLVHLPGGDLAIEWQKTASVQMTGPAVEVFRGVYAPR